MIRQGFGNGQNGDAEILGFGTGRLPIAHVRQRQNDAAARLLGGMNVFDSHNIRVLRERVSPSRTNASFQNSGRS